MTKELNSPRLRGEMDRTQLSIQRITRKTDLWILGEHATARLTDFQGVCQLIEGGMCRIRDLFIKIFPRAEQEPSRSFSNI